MLTGCTNDHKEWDGYYRDLLGVKWRYKHLWEVTVTDRTKAVTTGTKKEKRDIKDKKRLVTD